MINQELKKDSKPTQNVCNKLLYAEGETEVEIGAPVDTSTVYE